MKRDQKRVLPMVPKTTKVRAPVGSNASPRRPGGRSPLFAWPALGGGLFLFWLLLTGRFGLRVLVTGLLAVAVTLIFYRRFLTYFNLEPVAATGLLRVSRFAVRVVRDIFVSAWHHMKRVIYGSAPPELFTVELSLKDPMLIALIANAITLTPGSMTVEVSGSVLTVLAFVDGEEEVEAFRRQIHDRYERLLRGGRAYA